VESARRRGGDERWVACAERRRTTSPTRRSASPAARIWMKDCPLPLGERVAPTKSRGGGERAAEYRPSPSHPLRGRAPPSPLEGEGLVPLTAPYPARRPARYPPPASRRRGGGWR